MRFGKRLARAAGEDFAKPSSRPSSDRKIEIADRAGLLRVVDSRIFRTDRREWCRSMAEAAVRQNGVDSASLDLEAATCEIQFSLRPSIPAPTKRAMADAFAAALLEANASITASEKPGRRSSRSPTTWIYLSAFASEEAPSIWEADRTDEGRVRLRHQALQEKRGPGHGLASDLQAMYRGVGVCRFNRRARCLDIRLDPGSLDIPTLLRMAEDRLAPRLSGEDAAHTSDSLATLSPAGEPSILVDGGRRSLYLVLGCGAVVMSLVGISVPGVPTVTFAIAAGYLLARSSIRLHDRVVRSRLFGPVVREWLAQHGLSPGSKAKLIALTGTLAATSFVIVPITPLSLTVTFLLTSGGIYSIANMPGVDDVDMGLARPEAVLALPVSPG